MNTDITPAHDDTEKDLDDILQPLLDLFTEKYSDGWDFDGLAGFRVGGIHGLAVWSNCDGNLVELADKLAVHPFMCRALATLLHRTGTNFGADEDGPQDEDLARGPLRFSVVKKTLWDNEIASFLTGTHLLVDHFGYKTDAAERQVALLVRYLSDEANLIELSGDDLLRF